MNNKPDTGQPFYIGQRVVCVDDNYPNSRYKGRIKNGKVVYVDGIDTSNSVLCLTFREDQDVYDDQRYWYGAFRFAPITPLYEKSVLSELAEEAMKGVGDTADAEVRELVKN